MRNLSNRPEINSRWPCCLLPHLLIVYSTIHRLTSIWQQYLMPEGAVGEFLTKLPHGRGSGITIKQTNSCLKPTLSVAITNPLRHILSVYRVIRYRSSAEEIALWSLSPYYNFCTQIVSSVIVSSHTLHNNGFQITRSSWCQSLPD